MQPTGCSAGRHGISVVIPTLSRADVLRYALPQLLLALLRSPELAHEHSQIIINHGTLSSYRASAAIDVRIAELARRPVNMSKLTHSYGPRADAFSASRFFAAATVSRNEIVVTMDDDVMPYPDQIHPLLEGLACSVASEPGYPDYPDGKPPPGLHGNQERYCDREGYEQAPRTARVRARKQYRGRPLTLLTNYAAFSRTLARRLTAVWDAWYGALTARARGNGEDILFADGTRRLGGNLSVLQLHGGNRIIHTLDSSNISYSSKGNHYSLRKVTCCCLAAGVGTGEGLVRCVFVRSCSNMPSRAPPPP